MFAQVKSGFKTTTGLFTAEKHLEQKKFASGPSLSGLYGIHTGRVITIWLIQAHTTVKSSSGPSQATPTSHGPTSLAHKHLD